MCKQVIKIGCRCDVLVLSLFDLMDFSYSKCPNVSDKEKKILFGRGVNNARCGLHHSIRAMSH